VVRIVAVDTGLTWIVLVRINGRHIGTIALRIWKKSMTAKAEKPACIYGKRLRVIRVVDCRAVTVLTLDDSVRRREIFFDLFFMAFPTIFFSPIFDLEIFPIVDAALPVKTVGEISTVHAEVGRNNIRSDNQENSHGAYSHK